MTTLEMNTPPTAGPAGHYTPMHTFWACFLGYVANAMDVLIYWPALEANSDIVITKAGTVLIATVTFLTSAAGGWLAGLMSDRFSRKHTLWCMILLFAVTTFLCGFARDFAELLWLRAFMGIGFGGQWAAAAVLVGEAFGRTQVNGAIIGKDDRGLWVGTMQSGWAVGWFLAYFIIPHFIDDWRVMFWLGIWPIALIPYVWLFVQEPPVIVVTRQRRAADFLGFLAPEALWHTFLMCMLSIGALCGYWTIMIWLPDVVNLEKLPYFLGINGKGLYYFLLIVGSGFGYLVSARFSDLGSRRNSIVSALILIGILSLGFMDKTETYWLTCVVFVCCIIYVSKAMAGKFDLFGRRRNFVLFALFTVVAVFASICFAEIKITLPFVGQIILPQNIRDSIILFLAFPLGFFASGAFSGMGAFFTELFPTRMRGLGVGFTYNFGRGFMVSVLWLIPLLGNSGLGTPVGMVVLISYGLMIIAALLLPETLGTVLHADGEEAQETVPVQPATTAA